MKKLKQFRRISLILISIILLSYPISLISQVTGSGTNQYVPKWTSSSSIGNSAIFDNNGNIGIGTTSPTAKFQIYDYGTTYKFNQNALNIFVGIPPFSPGIILQSNTTEWKIQHNYDGHELDFQLNNISRIKFDNFGNILIGLGNPTSVRLEINGTLVASSFRVTGGLITGGLTVAGKVHAREIQVSLDAGADFVFKEGFKLRDIAELEQFIKANNHLPEIPSAKEMEENGLNMGEFQIKLLQKIEELTLYLIDLEKRNTELQQRVFDLEKIKGGHTNEK